MDIENFIKDLTPEQQEEASACTTVDELISYDKTEGINLGESDLNAISGGIIPEADQRIRCPECGYVGNVIRNGDDCECMRCSNRWKLSWYGHDYRKLDAH